MSDTDHGGPAAAHDAGHATDPGHDEHGHAADTLGPVDWTMWGVGLAGVIVALIVVAGFVSATGFAFNA